VRPWTSGRQTFPLRPRLGVPAVDHRRRVPRSFGEEPAPSVTPRPVARFSQPAAPIGHGRHHASTSTWCLAKTSGRVAG
jgi:hypothetical protein